MDLLDITNDILDLEDIKNIMNAVTRSNKSVTREQIDIVIRKAEEIAVESNLLILAMEGKIDIMFDENNDILWIASKQTLPVAE